MAGGSLSREPRLHHASQPIRVGRPISHGRPFPRHGARPAAERCSNWSLSMKSTTDLNMVNAYIPGRADVAPATAAMISRRDALLGRAYRLMYASPLHIVRGE